VKTVVVLGGYGNFGKRIVENLANIQGVTIAVAGRNISKAKTLISHLQGEVLATLKPAAIDILRDDFEQKLRELSPYLVIHTSGPFQGLDYAVPRACINVGAHYIDLADDRRFVCDITQLNDSAQSKHVLLASGASSVPGLSSAVIDYYSSQFSCLDTVDIAIAPGNKAERGEATVRGILSYTGHSFSVFKEGAWQSAFGWMDARRQDFGGIIGKRWLANVDVPDLELFPAHYDIKRRVRFQAGLELSILHLSMVGMAFLAKMNIVKDWSPLTKLIVKMSNLFMPLGSDKGAMQVKLAGADTKGLPKRIQWTLYAPGGIGPYIPTLSAIIVARKLLSGKVMPLGAMPCVGLLTLDDFLPHFESLGIYAVDEVDNIPSKVETSFG
jgi:hypothetical protein